MKPEDVTNTGPSYVCLWSSLANEKKLMFTIPTSSRGKPWSRVQLFVESVCGPLRGRFKLKDMSGTEMKTEPNTCISPGDYTLDSVDGNAELVFVEKKCGIVPSGRVGTSLSCTVASTILPSSHDTESASGGGSGSLQSVSPGIPKAGSKRKSDDTEDDSQRNALYPNFITAVYQRDNHCVISKSSTNLEASHILAHSWWNNTTGRRAVLPASVATTVHTLRDKIDDVRNGLLLRGDLAKAFGHGDFSLQLEGGHYRVVALSQAFESLDGVMLDENQRVTRDGSSWWKSKLPHPALVAFHLKQSVFAHMVVAGSDDYSSDCDGDDFCSAVGGEAAHEEGSHVSESLRETPCRGKHAEHTSAASDGRGGAATAGAVPTTWLAAARSCTQSSPVQL